MIQLVVSFSNLLNFICCKLPDIYIVMSYSTIWCSMKIENLPHTTNIKHAYILSQPEEKEEGRMESTGAVSYTHLDVYKRQVLTHRIIMFYLKPNVIK